MPPARLISFFDVQSCHWHDIGLMRLDLWPDNLIILQLLRCFWLQPTALMRYCSIQLKLCCLWPVHNIEMFQQPFVLGLFLLVATNPMCLPILHIVLVNHM